MANGLLNLHGVSTLSPPACDAHVPQVMDVDTIGQLGAKRRSLKPRGIVVMREPAFARRRA